MDYETITYDQGPEKHVARITMNRPQKRNAMDRRMLVELADAFETVENSQDIRVVIVRGNGPCFSSGHDLSLKDFPADMDGIIWHKKRFYFDLAMRIRNLRVPVVSQIHGYCIGAGLLLASLGDVLVCSDDTTFSDPVGRMGANSQEFMILPWIVGEKKAKELLFTGDSLKAEEAYRLGMINHIVGFSELELTVANLAVRIASMPPLTVTLMKQSINRTMDIIGYSNSMDAHFQSHLLSFATSEMNARAQRTSSAG